MDPEEAKSFVRGRSPEGFELLDAGLPTEYELEQLPAAKRIPFNKLPEELGRFDNGRPVLLSWEKGRRGRPAG